MARSPKGVGSLRRGFTLVELTVALAVLAVIVLITVPSFFHVQARRKLAGTAEQAAGLLRKARYDAIRHNRPVTVALDGGERVLFIDRDGDQAFDAAEAREGHVVLPTGIDPGGPPGDAAAVAGFTALGGSLPAAVLEPTGRLRGAGGGFRLRDARGNFLEVRVADPATALVVLRKWQDGGWRRQGETGETWRWNP